MRIGELASKAVVNIQSVRFYERRRLLREPVRTASGYRVYGKRGLAPIRFLCSNFRVADSPGTDTWTNGEALFR